MFLVSSTISYSRDVDGSEAFSESVNPNLTKVCYQVDGQRKFSALERVNCLLQLSGEARSRITMYGDIVGYNDVASFWEYLSMIPDPSCIWDFHHDAGTFPPRI
jgi:hypothetical protein